LGGLIPDLDVIPAIMTGQPIYMYHHIYTHTLLALGIMIGITAILRFRPLPTAVLLGFVAHLLMDFFDNSILPFSPFDQTTEWGIHISDWFISRGWFFEINLLFWTFSTTYLELATLMMSLSLIPIAVYLVAKGNEVKGEVSCVVQLGRG
jgi:hypothetical protein